MRSPRRVITRPRAKRNAERISQTVTLPNPDRPSWIEKRRSSAPAAIVAIISAPAAHGRVISAAIEIANRQSSPQLRASKPPCGRSQIAIATTSGTIQRHGAVMSARLCYAARRRLPDKEIARQVKEDRRGEAQRVDPVEHAAVPGDQRSVIL